MMSSPLAVPVPFLLRFPGSPVDDIVVFCVAVLVAVTVSAESQGFAATFLGDRQSGGGKRFHFNCFLHLDLLGTLCFFIAGFGWARGVEIDASQFKHPRLYLVLSRIAGPMGNFMAASIAASILAVLGSLGYEDKTFSSLVVVNLMTAIYGCICVYPLPGWSIPAVLLPGIRGGDALARYFRLGGPFLLIAWFFVARLSGKDPLGALLHPLVKALAGFLAAPMNLLS
jgi:hypothetical protein